MGMFMFESRNELLKAMLVTQGASGVGTEPTVG
jgi:hypothetical protein